MYFFKIFNAKNVYIAPPSCYNESMTNLPCDPAILMSYLNTLLRDAYDSLASLCDGLELEEEALLHRLEKAGLAYLEDKNRVEFC